MINCFTVSQLKLTNKDKYDKNFEKRIFKEK